jgi:hypothetical protein
VTEVCSDATSAWFLRQTSANFVTLRKQWRGTLTVFVPTLDTLPLLQLQQVIEQRGNVSWGLCPVATLRGWPKLAQRRDGSPTPVDAIEDVATKKRRALRRFNQRTGLLTARANWMVSRMRRSS